MVEMGCCSPGDRDGSSSSHCCGRECNRRIGEHLGLKWTELVKLLDGGVGNTVKERKTSEYSLLR